MKMVFLFPKEGCVTLLESIQKLSKKMISCFDVNLPESLKQFRKNVGKMH